MAASSPGLQSKSLGDDSDVLSDQEADISYLTVGFWRRSSKPGPLSLLVLHSSQTFVLLSEEPWKGQQVPSAPESKRLDFPFGRTWLQYAVVHLVGKPTCGALCRFSRKSCSGLCRNSTSKAPLERRLARLESTWWWRLR